MTKIEIDIQDQVTKEELDNIVDNITDLLDNNEVTIYLRWSRMRLTPIKNKS